jgi:hypothetical protein
MHIGMAVIFRARAKGAPIGTCIATTSASAIKRSHSALNRCGE